MLIGSSHGFSKLLRGTENIGTGVVADRGYIYRARVNTGDNPSFLEYCEANDILPLYRPNTGEMAFTYDRQADSLEQIQDNHDKTMAANSGRVPTFLRSASENTHLFKRIFKYFGHRAHNSRMKAIGLAKIRFYNNKYNFNIPAEFAESPKLLIEYLVMCGRFNQWHPKFSR